MGKIEWKSSSDGQFPSKAFRGGYDDDDNLLVIRSSLEGGLLPGKFHVSHDKGYIPLSGKEHAVNSYEVLVAKKGTLKWVSSSGGEIVSNALEGGKSAEGETLYIGRVHHSDTLTIGKVHPSHGLLYVPYGGEELSFSEYEILVKAKEKGSSSSESDEK